MAQQQLEETLWPVSTIRNTPSNRERDSAAAGFWSVLPVSRQRGRQLQLEELPVRKSAGWRALRTDARSAPSPRGLGEGPVVTVTRYVYTSLHIYIYIFTYLYSYQQIYTVYAIHTIVARKTVIYITMCRIRRNNVVTVYTYCSSDMLNKSVTCSSVNVQAKRYRIVCTIIHPWITRIRLLIKGSLQQTVELVAIQSESSRLLYSLFTWNAKWHHMIIDHIVCTYNICTKLYRYASPRSRNCLVA